MAKTFPTLKPVSISYDLGGLNVSDEATITAGPVRFRHSLRLNNNSMTLNYSNLTQAEVGQIRSHYEESGGMHYYFDVPSAIWGDSNEKVVPSTSRYRYNAKPEEAQRGIYHDCRVELTILTANDLVYSLSGVEAGLKVHEPGFSSFVFSGTAPFFLDNDDANPASEAELILNAGGAEL